MNYKISKELFKAVMDVRGTLQVFKITDFDVLAYDEYRTYDISLNNFFFKCFDWAYEDGYTLSFCTNDLSRLLRYGCLAEPIDNSSNYKEILSHNAHQTVFDVCQWILENKGIK